MRRLADVEDAARNLIANHYDASRESIQLDVQLEASEDRTRAGRRRHLKRELAVPA